MIKIDVPGAGSYNAKLMIIGEAPGKLELETGKNFIGPAGEILWEVLTDFGLKRPDIYITNVYKVRLPGDNIKRIDEIMSITDKEAYKSLLYQEIESIKPNCILALGNTALQTLTGKVGILKHRGSIYSTELGGFKVVGSIHPAMFLENKENKELYSWKQIVFLKFDVKRAIEESQFSELNIPRRSVTIAKNSYILYSYLERFKDAYKSANDIETYKGLPLCTSIAFNSYESVAFPLFDMYGPGNTSIIIPRHERCEMWRLYAEYLKGPVKKIGQNYNFDETIQDRYICRTNNFYSDILLKMSVLYPELPKKLAVSTSLFTRQPFYKDEGKEYNPKKDSPERELRYCGMDSMVTYEIDDALELEFNNIKQ